MKNNAEFRELAWKRLWADHWFGRLFGGGLLLGLCSYAANVVIGGILGRLGVQDWQDYAIAVAMNRKDLTTPIPNLTSDYIFQATSATVFEQFISFIMAGIAAYGSSVILLRCLKNAEEGWLGAAFGGFKDPFGMLWMLVRLTLIYLGWMIVAIFPLGVIAGACFPVVKPMLDTAPLLAATLMAIAFTLGISVFLAIYCIPFYRYRFAFLVKADHPDWSAGACIRSCKALMEWHKWQSFKLDCSYWKPITLVLLIVTLAVVAMPSVVLLKDNVLLSVMLGLFGVFALLACCAACIVLGLYIGVGQGFFYQDLKDGQTTEHNERN